MEHLPEFILHHPYYVALIVAAHPVTLAGLPSFLVDSSLPVHTADGENAIAAQDRSCPPARRRSAGCNTR